MHVLSRMHAAQVVYGVSENNSDWVRGWVEGGNITQLKRQPAQLRVLSRLLAALAIC